MGRDHQFRPSETRVGSWRNPVAWRLACRQRSSSLSYSSGGREHARDLDGIRSTAPRIRTTALVEHFCDLAEIDTMRAARQEALVFFKYALREPVCGWFRKSLSGLKVSQ